MALLLTRRALRVRRTRRALRTRRKGYTEGLRAAAESSAEYAASAGRRTCRWVVRFPKSDICVRSALAGRVNFLGPVRSETRWPRARASPSVAPRCRSVT